MNKVKVILLLLKILKLLPLIFLFGVGCNEEDEPKEDITFKLKYLVNIVEEDSINAVILETVTYYPKKNYSWYMYTNFQKKEFDQGIQYYAKDPVYIGCTRELQLYVARRYNGQSPKGGWRMYLFSRDTIKVDYDSIYVINWPMDSVKAIYIYNQNELQNNTMKGLLK